jgi:hypothetical protein
MTPTRRRLTWPSIAPFFEARNSIS